MKNLDSLKVNGFNIYARKSAYILKISTKIKLHIYKLMDITTKQDIK